MTLEFIYAEGCHSCHATRPIVDAWAKKHPDVAVYHYDGGNFGSYFPPEAPKRNGMFLTPTIAFRDGLKTLSITAGKLTETQLNQLYKKALEAA